MYSSTFTIRDLSHDQHPFTNRSSQFHGWRRSKPAAGVATPDRAAVSVEAATPRDSFSTSLFWILNMHHGGSWRGLHSFLRCSFSCSDRATRRCCNNSVLRCTGVGAHCAKATILSPIGVSMFCAPRDFFAQGILRNWNSCCVLVVPEALQQIGSSVARACGKVAVFAVSYISVFLISVIIICHRSDPILCLVSAKAVRCASAQSLSGLRTQAPPYPRNLLATCERNARPLMFATDL
ncbi:hypothetical protein BCR44DRAFT_177911 [Catenaria anguillulae PL171]|uniref:Uncharacterized protein n=1 Tax=Catenaria anguillulae PL171 TaxID=765915 RepID=A0A1Y2H7B7_9FUNG|nr:hypothetical protein BCR44DRAFT_177911 [Catenaria anguillulae PL171]